MSTCDGAHVHEDGPRSPPADSGTRQDAAKRLISLGTRMASLAVVAAAGGGSRAMVVDAGGRGRSASKECCPSCNHSLSGEWSSYSKFV